MDTHSQLTNAKKDEAINFSDILSKAESIASTRPTKRNPLKYLSEACEYFGLGNTIDWGAVGGLAIPEEILESLGSKPQVGQTFEWQGQLYMITDFIPRTKQEGTPRLSACPASEINFDDFST